VSSKRNLRVEIDSQCIVKFSFLDKKYLYLIMVYLPGDDKMTILMREDVACFYILESILAIHSIYDRVATSNYHC